MAYRQSRTCAFLREQRQDRPHDTSFFSRCRQADTPGYPAWQLHCKSAGQRRTGQGQQDFFSLARFQCRRALSLIEHFQFETLCVSNHTACRFAEKARFFRSVQNGRRCAAARLLPAAKAKHSGSHCTPGTTVRSQRRGSPQNLLNSRTPQLHELHGFTSLSPCRKKYVGYRLNEPQKTFSNLCDSRSSVYFPQARRAAC